MPIIPFRLIKTDNEESMNGVVTYRAAVHIVWQNSYGRVTSFDHDFEAAT
jgi:hypothetical protein